MIEARILIIGLLVLILGELVGFSSVEVERSWLRKVEY